VSRSRQISGRYATQGLLFLPLQVSCGFAQLRRLADRPQRSAPFFPHPHDKTQTVAVIGRAQAGLGRKSTWDWSAKDLFDAINLLHLIVHHGHFVPDGRYPQDV
jgi:hypothetical protein